MKFYSLLLFVPLLAHLQCTTVDSKDDQTPEVLQTDKSSVDLTSFESSYSYRKSLIDKLFEEAQEKNIGLKNYLTEVEAFRTKETKVLNPINSYLDNNEQYWTEAKALVSGISDSTLAKDVLASIDEWKSQYEKSIAQLRGLKTDLKNGDLALSDQQVLMKILVTAAMMQTYNANEHPKEDELIQLLKEQSKLTEKAQSVID